MKKIIFLSLLFFNPYILGALTKLSTQDLNKIKFDLKELQGPRTYDDFALSQHQNFEQEINNLKKEKSLLFVKVTDDKGLDVWFEFKHIVDVAKVFIRLKEEQITVIWFYLEEKFQVADKVMTFLIASLCENMREGFEMQLKLEVFKAVDNVKKELKNRKILQNQDCQMEEVGKDIQK